MRRPIFLRKHHHLDVLVVLEAIADDRRIVVGDRKHSQQLRLGAGFEAEMIGAAETENFFDNLPLLIYLDRVNAAVAALIAVLADGEIECLVHLLQAMLQNVGKADQNRQRYSPPFEGVDELLQVNGSVRFLCGVNEQIAVLANREVPLAPTRDIVKLRRVIEGPSISRLTDLRLDCGLAVQRGQCSSRWDRV